MQRRDGRGDGRQQGGNGKCQKGGEGEGQQQDKSVAGSSHDAHGSSKVYGEQPAGSSSTSSQPTVKSTLNYARAVTGKLPQKQSGGILTEKSLNVKMEEWTRLKNLEIMWKQSQIETKEKIDKLFSQLELYKNMEESRKKLWTTMPDKSKQEIYTPSKFIAESKKCLTKNPPNLIMSSENAWGGFCAAVALFFKDLVIKLDGVEFIGINLLTHSATVGMGFFLAGMMSRFLSKSGNSRAVGCAIKCHRNFYRGFLIYTLIEEFIVEIEDYIKKLDSLDKKTIATSLSRCVTAGKYEKPKTTLYFNKKNGKDFICGVEYSFELEIDDKPEQDVLNE